MSLYPGCQLIPVMDPTDPDPQHCILPALVIISVNFHLFLFIPSEYWVQAAAEAPEPCAVPARAAQPRPGGGTNPCRPRVSRGGEGGDPVSSSYLLTYLLTYWYTCRGTAILYSILSPSRPGPLGVFDIVSWTFRYSSHFSHYSVSGSSSPLLCWRKSSFSPPTWQVLVLCWVGRLCSWLPFLHGPPSGTSFHCSPCLFLSLFWRSWFSCSRYFPRSVLE